jgi:hypothetical protein
MPKDYVAIDIRHVLRARMDHNPGTEGLLPEAKDGLAREITLKADASYVSDRPLSYEILTSL